MLLLGGFGWVRAFGSGRWPLFQRSQEWVHPTGCTWSILYDLPEGFGSSQEVWSNSSVLATDSCCPAPSGCLGQDWKGMPMHPAFAVHWPSSWLQASSWWWGDQYVQFQRSGHAWRSLSPNVDWSAIRMGTGSDWLDQERWKLCIGRKQSGELRVLAGNPNPVSCPPQGSSDTPDRDTEISKDPEAQEDPLGVSVKVQEICSCCKDSGDWWLEDFSCHWRPVGWLEFSLRHGWCCRPTQRAYGMERPAGERHCKQWSQEHFAVHRWLQEYWLQPSQNLFEPFWIWWPRPSLDRALPCFPPAWSFQHHGQGNCFVDFELTVS